MTYTRRRFLALGGLSAVGLLSACAPAATPAAPTAAPKPAEPPKPAATQPPAQPQPAPTAAPTAAPAAKAPAAGASSKDTLTFAQTQDATSLDPPMHTLIQNNSVLVHMFDSLVYLDAQGKLQPQLATSWEATNPTTWTFKLRQGVKFHNGEPLDAGAVKFSLDRTLNPDQKSPTRPKIAAITKVDAPDPATLVITTKDPFALLPYTLVGFGAMPVPPKYVQEKGDKEVATKPVGTGPYKFVEWVKDQHIIMEANPDYWGDKAKVKRITIRPIPENATRVAELRTGGVDLIINPPPQEMKGLESGDTKTIVQPSLWAINCGIDTLRDGPLTNPKVRQALNYAVDKEAIIKNVMGGLGKPINSLAVPEVFGYDASTQPYPYDPNKAKALLAEAGFAGGFPLTLTTRQGNTLNDKDASEAIVGYLKAVGIQAQLKVVENGVWAQWSANKGRDGIWYGGWRGDYPEVDGYSFSNLATDQFNSYVKNLDIDKTIFEARKSIDPKARAEQYAALAKLQFEQATHIFLYQLPDTYAARKNLEWTAKPDSIVELWGARFS
ncbi:MAG: ABC transporter substrate-binding protein [Chloroflexota bacterium]